MEKKEQKQKTYDPAIDILRIISILAVIFIHTTTKTIEMSSNDLVRVPWTLFLNQISRFAVPLFFMISGFVLELNYPFHSNYFEYLKKRINRILIPYVFWSFIYYFFVYKQHTTNFFQTLFFGDASYQLYFIPTLLIFYIIFPLFHKYYSIIANKWVLILLGLLQLMFLYYDYYVKSLPFYYPLSIALLNYYVFTLGIVVSHNQNKIKEVIRKWKIIIISLSFILAGFIFFEGRNTYLETHNYLSFYSQWRPSIFFYTVLISGVLYYIFSRINTKFSTIKNLSKLSFFVFFIHVIILETVWNRIGIYIFNQTQSRVIEQFWYDPLFFTTIASISFFAAYIAHKIPLLSKLSG